MKLHLTLTISLFLSINNFAQSKIEKLKENTLKEGLLLYQSEKASWHGTDLFLEQYKNESNVGGYVSYTDGDSPKCVFVSKNDKTIVIGTISFDKSFDLSKAKIDLSERKVNSLEQDYLNLRTKTIEALQTDTIFKYYENTSYNIVPLITGKEKKAYVLTASKENGKVIIGNDYLINFNKNGDLKKTSRLHKGMLAFDYGKKDMLGIMHNHLPGYNEIFTPTDICTMMLYQTQAGWEKNHVVSKKYVSIWDCKKNDLVVLTMEAWEKISRKE
ncbi:MULTISPECIES: hypothetical protein [Flavobacterium]|uniref:hypothetical protein n=1 Tax=Flavobacterium TaxID=237 RepID=UPI001FCB142F|nr:MULTISPECIES: hypothetical protein [Flavobacterium]UOK41711.1 hypothetical protein LZF87_10355 [Flavobacterium enshiense]